MSAKHPRHRGLCEQARAVAEGELSAVALTEQSLAAIHSESRLNAFLHVADEAALRAAETVDRRRARGEALGALGGVPLALKDALCTADQPTTAGSKILTRDGKTPATGWRPVVDATVVERLRAAGAVIMGKTNLDEFAMGSSNENSAFGPVRNPWDLERSPGGSSGGSAAAVAARLTPGALGSDTGGSIRQPASLSGVVGVKPTYGRVSRYGLVAFASSLDQIGPFATDVRGAARLLSVIAGHDPRDSTSSTAPVPALEAACDEPLRGLRVGLPAEYFAEGLDPEVERCVRDGVRALEDAGCAVKPVRLPHTHFGLATYYLVATAEASSNLARFDGVRFGLRVEPPRASLADLYGASRDAGFGPEVKRRIMLGTYALSAGYYDAYYLKAQKVRTLIRRDFDAAFAEVDLLATPTSPVPAFRLGEKVSDPLQMYLADVYTLPASLAGIAGLSVPCGLTRPLPDRGPLPVGLQLLAPAFGEPRLFAAAAAVERALGVLTPPSSAAGA